MKKVLLSVLAAFSIAANAQTDISVTSLLPVDGTEYNTTDTNIFIFRVTNEGTTPLTATDTVYYRMHVDSVVLTGPASTFYPAIRAIDSLTNEQSVLAPDSSFIYAFAYLPFEQATVDLFTIHKTCYDVLLWDPITNTEITEDDDANNTSCNEGITPDPVGVNEYENAFSTYPNPVVNELNINLNTEKGLVTVFEMSGRQITSVRISEGANSIDVSNLAKGNYMFVITNDNAYIGTGKFQK